MIVDAHVHLLPDRVRAAPEVAHADRWFAACHASPRARLAGPGDLLAAMEADAVDRAVCLGWPFADPTLCAEQNDWLAAAVAASGRRLAGFGIVNPADPGAAAEVRRCARLGLRGIGELNADAQGWALEDDAAVGPVAAACVETGLVVTLHCSEPVGHAYPGKGTATPDRVLALSARHPELRIVCAHLGGGLPLYAHMPEVLSACRSALWFDTAAQPFLYDPGVLRHLAALVGADRLLLGSDFPLLGAARSIAAVDAAGLGAGDRAALLGGTAAALLGLA